MSQAILPLLKLWRPDLKWLGNECSYSYKGGEEISVECYQFEGQGRYKAVIKGVEGCDEIVDEGPDCYTAVARAIFSLDLPSK